MKLKIALMAVALSQNAFAYEAAPTAPTGVMAATGADSAEMTVPAKFSPEAVRQMIASGQATVETVSAEEAKSRAEANGVEIGDDVDTDIHYGRPWFILRTGIGIPNVLGASVEVYLRDWLTVEAGTGVGLLPSVFEGSIRWRPEFACWGCDGKTSFSLSLGIDPGVYLTNNSFKNSNLGIMVTGTMDATFMHRFAKHFGVVASTRAGIGAVNEFNDGTPFRIEPTIKLNLIQVGLVF